MKHSRRGFTLIELLVVIAIIGLLSSVVLASLNSARSKSKDAAIKQTLSNLRSQAGIYFNQNGNYGTRGPNIPGPLNSGTAALPCNDPAFVTSGTTLFDPVNTEILNLLTAAGQAGGGTIANTYCTYLSNGSGWAASVQLVGAGGNEYWCVDSTGASKQVNDPSTRRGLSLNTGGTRLCV